MSDAEVALLLRLIRTLLNKAIDRLELILDKPEFADKPELVVITGQEDNVFNPVRKYYPILEELYSLRDVLADGVDDLLRTKTARENNT